MIPEGHIIKNEIKDEISMLEKEYDVKISTIQKILLSINGPITSILDTLYGTVHLFMLDQHLEKSQKSSEIIGIEKGEEILYRESIVHKGGRPLVHVTSVVPTARCSEKTLKDLLEEKLTTGKIMDLHNHETLRRITKISIESPNYILQDLFKTDEDMLTREYIMIHKGKVIIWTKEAYPLSYFVI
jgi:chorismate-pyruvate lyase